MAPKKSETTKSAKKPEKAPAKKATTTKKAETCSAPSKPAKATLSLPQGLHSHPDHPGFHDGHSGGCCGSRSSGCSTTMESHAVTTKSTGKKSTRVVVNYDVGFKNTLYIRGSSCDLCWEKGKAMKNEGPCKWVWETDKPFTSCEFKVLINDKQYECGENQKAKCGYEVQYTPKF